MHMVIRAIVYGEIKKEAFEQARSVFERLCENQSPFDYFTTFDENGLGVSGKDRWGKLPVIVLADSKKGKELIQKGFNLTKKSFMKSIGTLYVF